MLITGSRKGFPGSVPRSTRLMIMSNCPASPEKGVLLSALTFE